MSASRIAFFGATGDCAGFTLANALNGGHDCVALVRSPEKLKKSMTAKSVSSDAVDQHLTVVEGNVKDVGAVKRALQVNGKVVDVIVSGIGGTPQLQWSLFKPVILNDMTICQDAGKTILGALTQLKPTSKPLLINVSTTGIAPKGKPRDVPLLFVPLYHWMLQVPHADKMVLEERLAQHMQLPEGERGLGTYVNVKPSLLMDGEGHGLQIVREGTEDQPALGYTIQRKDVGAWIYERLIEKGVKDEWRNSSVCITY